MIYERRLSSLTGIKRELRTLDGDAGMRIEGAFKGRKCFGFVTRFEETYTVIVCEAKGRNGATPGKPVASKTFGDLGETVRFISSFVVPKVRAYAY